MRRHVSDRHFPPASPDLEWGRNRCIDMTLIDEFLVLNQGMDIILNRDRQMDQTKNYYNTTVCSPDISYRVNPVGAAIHAPQVAKCACIWGVAI
jgi:hypothetical protein